MSFNSLEFLIFFTVVFFSYWALPHRFRTAFLLCASCYFYMSWNVELILLIMLSVVISWGSALAIDHSPKKGMRKALLYSGVAACLLPLFFFKYFDFFSLSVAQISNSLFPQSDAQPVLLDLILPVGISFYTFQTLSYIIDVYRGDLKAERNFITYALYVTFFPQLVAGPIERATNLLPQFNRKAIFSYERAIECGQLILWGMFKKMAIADVVAVSVNAVFNDIHQHSGPGIVMATVLFAFQIYCDFSAYSDIAIGCAGLLGFKLMTNFDCPYFAESVREFWKRWHISLTSWFRDYVYIPLGGSRCSQAKKRRNLLIIFCLSGLWHGAAWHFVIWGVLNGLYEIAEDIIGRIHPKAETQKSLLRRIFSICITFLLVDFAWMFFRINSMADAVYAITHLFQGWSLTGINQAIFSLGGKRYLLKTALSIGILFVYDGMARYKTPALIWLKQQKKVVRWAIYYTAVIVVFITFLKATAAHGNVAEFIYFQF